uniref:Uncharacterized protein n=1 Tax=Anguilla anguilla TaxID=7936 RepID=A0A0E9XLH9_ANGAN
MSPTVSLIFAAVVDKCCFWCYSVNL